MFGRAELFVKFCRGHYGVYSCEIILNLDQEKMSFKEKVYRWMHSRRRTKTDHNSSP